MTKAARGERIAVELFADKSSVAMETSDSLARLLRLRGAIEWSLEDPATIDAFSTEGLRESYGRLRAQVRDLVVECDVDADEFDALFPEHATAESATRISIAKAAASLLRQLDGYLGGLVQTQAINEQLTLEQLERARGCSASGGLRLAVAPAGEAATAGHHASPSARRGSSADDRNGEHGLPALRGGRARPRGRRLA